MNQCLARVIVATSLLATIALPAAGQGTPVKRHRVAILDFEEQGERVEAATGKIAAELLTTGLVNTGRFEVVERDRLQQVIKEQQLGLSDLVRPETAAQIGNLVGVQVIITGTIYRLQDVAGMSAKLISTQDASILTAEETRGGPRSTVHELVDHLLPLIMNDFPLEGYIVNREADHVVIDMGDDFGLHAGQEFNVYVPGAELRHPVTNEILEREEIHKGTIRVVTVKSRTADCQIIEEADQPIERGNLIKSLGFDAQPVQTPVMPAPTPARAEPRVEPSRSTALGGTTWADLPGRPTMLLFQIVEAPEKFFQDGMTDRLRVKLGNAVHAAGLARPVLSTQTRDPEDSEVPPEYAGTEVLLAQIVVEEWKIRTSGDTDVEFTCNVFQPSRDRFVTKKSVQFEVERHDFGSQDEMIDFMMQQFADKIVKQLSSRL